jgi:hypothetical protein
MTITAGPASLGYGSRAVAVLEDMWVEIRARHPELPALVIVTGAGADMRGPRNWNLHGQHCPNRWVVDPAGGRADELFVAGEDLAGGGAHILKIMLHEAAHALASLRGVKDTSRGNRYHNRRFVALAVELGLAGPDQPNKVSGFSAVTLPDGTAAAYTDLITAVDAAQLPHMDGYAADGSSTDSQDDDDSDAQEKRGGRRAAVTCRCPEPRKIYLTARQIEQGPILCGVCSAEFTNPDTDTTEEIQPS